MSKREIGSIDICQNCGQEYIVNSGNQKYCKNCDTIIKRKNGREIGSLDICQNCGLEYIVKRGNQKYCPDCTLEMRREYSRLYFGMHKHDENYRKRMLSHKICAVCGEIFKQRHIKQNTCCTECRRIYNNLQARKKNAREIGSIDICQNCGQEYKVKGGIQKYCENCDTPSKRKNNKKI